MSKVKSAVDGNGIPIVDLGQLGVGFSEVPPAGEMKRVVEELLGALGGVGFVYLTNHGIPNQQIEDMFSVSTKFFSLSEEVKQKYEASAKDDMHGYVPRNREKLDFVQQLYEVRESYYLKHMDGSFPDEEVPNMRPVTSTFRDACVTLADRLLIGLALALDIEKDFFTSNHKEMYINGGSQALMRVNHYPAIPSSTLKNAIRCGAHTDYGTITLLFQDDMGGLQVRDVSGSWVDVEPIPGTIVVNAGDLLQYWTNGRIVATEHRVIIPEEEVRRRVPRQSVVLFVHPDDKTMVTPLDGSNSDHPINSKQYVLDKYDKTY